MVRTGFPDIRVVEEQSIANGDMVGVLALWRGTHRGAFFGIEPTGRSVEMRGVVLWRIVDGQLGERWAVLDYDTLLKKTTLVRSSASDQSAVRRKQWLYPLLA
jgi:predicted ester cyclase